MGPHERRTVHVYLRERSEVQTHSEGDEPDRRLVVTPVRLAPSGVSRETVPRARGTCVKRETVRIRVERETHACR